MSIQLTKEMRLNPFPQYAKARRWRPVYHQKEHDIWNVFRYEDVKMVLGDHRRFSSNLSGASAGASRSLITSDPPRHTQLRSLINRAFTPRSVANLEPRIVELAYELLDTVIESGQIDLVTDLAGPLPVVVIAELLGIPAEHRDRFKVWSDYVVASSDAATTGRRPEEDHPGYDAAMKEMATYFQEIISQRRNKPGDDLVSALLQAEIEGERLSSDDLFNFCWLLLVAGNETTINLITNAVLCLLENPTAAARLADDQAMIPSAIEEVLRYRSPVQAMFRVAAEDTTLHRSKIKKGQRIIAWIGSANRDKTRFSDPERFDIERDPNPHLAFGHGIHFCLGAPLARLEARIALTAILDRLKNLQRVDNGPLEPVKGFIVHGVEHLPLLFTPDGAASD